VRETTRYKLQMQIRKATKTGFFAPGRQSRGGKKGGSRNTEAQQNARRENIKVALKSWDDPVYREMMRQRARENQGSPDIGRLGKKASHMRWHVARNKPNPSCPLCCSTKNS